MAERQGFENNDFTGGITDEFVSSKDNCLDAAVNICLDDDLTISQRPGSDKIPGTDVYFGKIAAQNAPSVGLISTADKLYSFTTSKAFSYTSTVFEERLFTQSPDTHVFNQPFFNDSTTLPITTTPLTTGAINGYADRDIVYATNTEGAFPHKFLKTSYQGVGTDFSGEKILPIGLPKPPEWKDTNGPSTFYLCRRRGGTGISQSVLDVVYTATPAETQIAVSDRPYKYTMDFYGNISNITYFTYTYLFTVVFKATYYVNGIKYEKQSAPATPWYFLSAISLRDVSDVGRPYIFVIKQNLRSIVQLMNQMHVPLFDELFASDVNAGEVNFSIDAYISEDDGTVLQYCNKYYDNIGQTGTIVQTTQSMTDFNTSRYTSTPSEVFIPFYLLATPPEKRIPLYTTGGVLPYTAPPVSRYIARVGEYTYYANTKQPVVEYFGYATSRKLIETPYRVYQSNVLDPDSVPEGNFIEFPDPVMGVAAVLDRCIVATTKAIYRIDGRFDDFGGGLVAAQILSKETGCMSHKSMIAVKDKLFFFGNDGVYVTDGVYVANISRHLSRTYKTLTNTVQYGNDVGYYKANTNAQADIAAAFDEISDRVIFSLKNKALALELKASRIEAGYGAFFGPWIVGHSEIFLNNEFYTVGVFKDLILRTDHLGYVYMMSPGITWDPNSSSYVTANLWGKRAILYRMRTARFAFGSLVVKKWVSILTLVLKRRSGLNYSVQNLDVAINAYNDGDRVRQELKPVHYSGARDTVFNADPKAMYESVQSKPFDTLLNVQRRFGPSGLRCLTKAVELTNALRLVAKSDDYGTCVVTGGNAVISGSWPVTSTNQSQIKIAFEFENYDAIRSVTVVSSNTLAVSPAPPDGTYKWQLKRFPDNQYFGLHSLGMVYSTFGSKHEAYVLQDQGFNEGVTGE